MGILSASTYITWDFIAKSSVATPALLLGCTNLITSVVEWLLDASTSVEVEPDDKRVEQ
jgi:hypothetical protein